jgi:meso-butanediol dehydrogenase / (S,S)-butanediol dehydrogenase / diacetyl reductase
MAERFEGKIVIVTRSASGIGEATARRFVAEGAARFTARQDRE